MQFILRYISKARYYFRIFKPAIKHLKNSLPVLLFLGFVLSLVGIWWLGPKWEWKETYPLLPLMPRILATVVILLMAAVTFGIYSQRKLKSSEQARLNAEEQDPVTPYIEAQQGRLADTMDLLRENLGSKDYIYTLPWYLVLGGESVGKTSLINRTGQHFSFTTATRVSTESDTGIRRRRDAIIMPYEIDWWMCDQAILIDPDGGLLVQQDNDEEKQILATRLWQHFIDWLGETRERRPLNGVVLVVDLARLVNQKPSDRKAYAGIMRARLREMMEKLGTRLPVYIVLSKFDLIKGFDAYFRGIKKSQREDVFGVTFKLDQIGGDNQWLDELDDWYNQLLKMLNDQIFDAMAATTVLEDRENLFAFARQLVGIKEGLQEFLADVLESDRFSTPAQVRGLYFTSVFQHGIPVNPFLDTSARNYKVPLPVSSALPSIQSTTFFVKQLFSNIIYPESGLATDNEHVVKHKQKISRVGAGVAALFALVMISGFQFYFNKNSTSIGQVIAATSEYSNRLPEEHIDETGKKLLPPLNQIRQATLAFADYDQHLPGLAELGLYQGRAIGPKTEAIYQEFLSRRFLPAIATGVVEQMNTAPYASDQKLMGLRVYRMIEDKENRRKKVVTDWMDKLWKTSFTDDIDTQKQLMVHLDYAMDNVGAELPGFENWVRNTQTELLTIPLPDRVYRTMKQNAVAEFSAPLDIRNAIGPAFDVIYKHEQERRAVMDKPLLLGSIESDGVSEIQKNDDDYLIDSVLTKPGFKDYFITANETIADLAMIDTWVLGMREALEYSEEDKKELRQQIRELYVADYISTWNRGLRKLEVNDFESIAHAVKVLDTFSGATTPLQRLLKSVKENSFIYAVADENNKEVNEALQLDPNRKAAMNIQKSFIRLTELLEAKDDKPAYIEEVLKSISALHEYMREIQEASNPDKKALTVAHDRFSLRGSDPISILHRVSNGLPEPLKRQLNKISEESWRVILIQALQELERKWDKEVYQFYEERLKNRYPLAVKGKDASLDDFTRFFAPDGILDTFYKEYLSIFLESDMEVLFSRDRKGFLIREDLVEQIEQARVIMDAYFNAEGALHVPFTLEPLALSGSHRKSVLNIDGQIISYNHGPAYAVDLLWPNTLQNRAESKIVMVSTGGKNTEAKASGVWSLFRLLRRGHVNPASNNSAILSFGLNKGVMRYRLRGAGSNNPFSSKPLANYTVPRYLLSESKPGEAVAPDGVETEVTSMKP